MNGRRDMRREAGLTLVELMIALTLSMVLLGGVMVLFSGNKISYRMQQGLSSIQDSGRFAISQIKRDIESAGFGGCLTEDLKDTKPVLWTSALDYVEDFRDGIRITGQNDVSGLTIDSQNVVDDTDVIRISGPLNTEVFYVTQRIFPNNAIKVQGNASAQFAVDDFLIISDCSGADIFKVASSPSSSAGETTIAHNPALLSRKFGADAVVAALFSHTYFIGQSAGVSSTGAPVPALFRFDGTSAQEILQGVEDMQVTYGVDTDVIPNGLADGFQDADGVVDWSQVVSVRVALLVNSIDEASQQAASYMYLPAGSTAVAPPGDDRLLRQEYSAVLTLRNNVL